MFAAEISLCLFPVASRPPSLQAEAGTKPVDSVGVPFRPHSASKWPAPASSKPFDISISSPLLGKATRAYLKELHEERTRGSASC
jgi:hypothetical protein